MSILSYAVYKMYLCPILLYSYIPTYTYKRILIEHLSVIYFKLIMLFSNYIQVINVMILLILKIIE